MPGPSPSPCTRPWCCSQNTEVYVGEELNDTFVSECGSLSQAPPAWFREEHGRWPAESEGTLGLWCTRQRQAKKGNRTYPISPAKVVKLDAIGFDWGSVMTADEKWDATLDDVRRFREEHGRWPAQSEGTLGWWCKTCLLYTSDAADE